MATADQLHLHPVLIYATVESCKKVYSFPITSLKKVVVDGNYCDFYFTNRKKITLYGSLTNFEDQLAGNGFVRLNRSELVSLWHLEEASVNEGAVLPEKESVTVSRRGMARLKQHHQQGVRSHKK